MLKNRYQEILIGLNLTSLLRGFVSLQRKQSTLLIDDRHFYAESYPTHFLSELEIAALLRFGKKYNIPELSDLRKFLIPAETEFVTDAWRLKLGASPSTNMRELLRKFPELLSVDEASEFNEGSEFDESLLSELRRYETLTYESSLKPKGLKFELQGPKWLKTVYQRFGEFLNQEYSTSQELRSAGLMHLLGLSAEDRLKTRLGPEEIPFYFFRLLSPIHRLQDFVLLTQLKRRLHLMGGDFKESSVQYWQIHKQKFENLLLQSFEGVISAEKVLFFSHFPDEVSFSLRSPYPIYRKTQVSPPKRVASPFPPKSLTFIAYQDHLGSHTPFRVMARSNELSYFQVPYLDEPGSKAQFYAQDLTSSYEKDAQFVPFEKLVGATVTEGVLGVSLDMRQVFDNRKKEAPVLSRIEMDIVDKDHKIQGFEYWGPFRYQSLGILALCYGVETP
jgi:hypothetical protein